MQLKAAERLFKELQDTPLQAVMQLATDPARQLIDERLGGEILGIDPSQMRDIATSLALEPRVHGGKGAQMLTRAIASTDVKE